MKSKAFIVCILYAVLCIPTIQAQELLDYPLDTVNGEEVYKYQVEKSIGLYRIGVNFNVSQSEIIRLNPHLRDRVLHYGETLLLPTKRKIEPKAEVIEPKAEEIELTAENDSMTVQDSTDTSAPIPAIYEPDTTHRHVVELALLLPFEGQQAKRSANAERMMEFYQGALIALHNLQNDSTLYRLRVYDSERSERRIKALCDSTELDNVQGILGLVYPIQIERMAEWCSLHDVPMLVPFSDDIDLPSHPNVLQFNATAQQEADSLCAWMEARKEDIHIMLTEVRDAELSASIRTLHKQLKAHDLAYTSLPLHDLMNDSASHVLDPEKENIIILHSDRYQQVRILLPHIAAMRTAGFNVRIVSQYAWQKEHIDLPQVYTSMFTQDTVHTDYDSLWEQAYVSGHISDNPRYDLLGYDLMQALVGRLQGKEEYSGLQSAIRWKQMDNGGYQNECVRVVAY